MKLLPASPVEFLDPLSKPPESLYVAEIRSYFVSSFIAGTPEAVVFASRAESLDEFSHDLYIQWGINSIRDSAPLKNFIESYEAYFNGGLRLFKAVVLPLAVTPFTLKVHHILTRIPFGRTLSYSEVATLTGRPGAARAVGNACGKNRTLIIIPCHRVLAANGLGGFGAGLDFKRQLLRHEGIEVERIKYEG